MLVLKTSAHIRAGRHIKGLNSCRHSTGIALSHLETLRLRREEARLARAEARRGWIIEQWNGHFRRAASPLRALPPSGRR